MSRLTLLAALLLAAGPARAQVLDQGVLLVEQEGREVAREEFSLRRGRLGDPGGSTLEALARYPGEAPLVRIAALLERTGAGEMANFRLEVQAAAGLTRVRAQGSRTRVGVQVAGGSSVTAREYPGGSNVVVLDDSLFALHAAVADLASPQGRPITALFPRTERRVALVARREAPVETEGMTLTPVRLSGGLSGTIWVDGAGLLQRIELPGRGIRVTRMRS